MVALLPGQTLDNTIGAVFLGIIGSSILFGGTLLQVYLYYHHFPLDSRLHKYSVAILFILDTAHLALTLHAAYAYMVTGFGHIDASIIWSIKLQVVLNIIIILIVQGLYAYRVWRLGGYHRGVLGYLVASVVAGGFVIGTVFAIELYRMTTFLQLSEISWAIDASLAASTTIDFIISMAMCYYLRKTKNSISHLNSRISTVMQYSLSSGLCTSAVSLSTLFTYTLLPNTLVYLGLQFMVTKLYVGSFLAMMNARQDQRENHTTQHSLRSMYRSSEYTPTYVGSGEPLSAVSETSAMKKWDLEAPPQAAAYPFRHQQQQVPSAPNGRPEYARNW